MRLYLSSNPQDFNTTTKSFLFLHVFMDIDYFLCFLSKNPILLLFLVYKNREDLIRSNT